jgi:hypothetical protein
VELIGPIEGQPFLALTAGFLLPPDAAEIIGAARSGTVAP